ncbi:sugar ABC transporter substrate-binding protein [Streptomyces sp. NPDC101110]|uniref:sugar ABC transporter substrate-binding protein n=1 Tax=unclassified Streptomyces TaxID=2593676 RepID=UPI0038180EFE
MNTNRKIAALRTVRALTASASALSLAACGVISQAGGNSAGATRDNNLTIGLLLPDKETKRFDAFDYPIFEREVAALTENRASVHYANAKASAVRQSRQLEQMITDKVDVLVVDAVDAKAIAPAIVQAKNAGIPVIAYDRLAQGPIDAYISHDNELVGEVQVRALIEALGPAASSSKIVMLNGSPTDPNTAALKKGALNELEGQANIAVSYDTRDWLPKVAKANMQKAIRSLGASNIAAVYSANDGIAGAAIEALKEAGVDKLPPVTGQDADLEAVQRLVSGEQYMTVYKPFLLEAKFAAEMAVARAQGRMIAFAALTPDRVDSPTHKNIASKLVPVVALTKSNIGDTVLQDGVYTTKDICTTTYRRSCAAIGLK